MGIASGKILINLKDILIRASELDILTFYLGIKNIPCVINSPLRKDKKPSFGLYSNDGVKIYYIDLSKGNKGGVIDLLMKMWNTDYQTTLQRIYNDLPKFTAANGKISCHIKKNHTKNYSDNSDLQCKIRDWQPYDIKYWEQYGVSLEWLKFGDIYPISHIIVVKDKGKYVIPADKLAYAYIERKDNKVSLKIYQPKSKRYKWINKHDSSVWDLWDKLPQQGDKLIITSSRKDALCIWENTGIPACSLQAESYLPKEHVVDELKKKFKNIYVLYDNDFTSEVNHGELLGFTMATTFGLKQLKLPNYLKSKDSSDLVKNYGRQQLKDTIYKLLKKD